MADFYNSGPEAPPSEGDQLETWYKRMAFLLAISFIFPIYAGGFGGGKLIFPNIQLIGKVGFFGTVMALYPLLAAVIIFLILANMDDIRRAIILLITGLFPILSVFFFKGDIVAGAMGEAFKAGAIVFGIGLSLIGVFVGSKVIAVHYHDSGKYIGGISGIVYMLLVLLPLDKSGVPIYFSLFKMLKSSGKASVFGSSTFLVVIMIAIFSAFLYASFIAILNMRDTSSVQDGANRAMILVFWGSVALPASVFILTLFSSDMMGMKSTVIMTMIKYISQMVGIAGLISLSMWDLVDQLIPKTTKGGDLFADKV
jgi:hypothetical protein